MKTRMLAFLLISAFVLGAFYVPPVSFAHAAEKEGAKQSEENGNGQEKEKKGEKKGKEESDITGGRFEGDPIYVHISPMTLPVINDDGIEQLVSLALSVHVKNIEAANTLHKEMPRVTDALMRHLYGGLGSGDLRKGKMINLPKIKRNAMLAIGEIINKDDVVDVLIEGVSQRML